MRRLGLAFMVLLLAALSRARLQALAPERSQEVRWLAGPSGREAAARWQPVLARFLPPRLEAPLTVRVFPDAAAKGRETGSTRPADLTRDGRGFRVDLDASAPRDPDRVTPVLAAAALAAGQPPLAERPLLLHAFGARDAGTWWGRPVVSFSAFLDRAGVEPSLEDVLEERRDVSPVLAIGAAAAWLDAGIRREGESAVRSALLGSNASLSVSLARWRSLARKETVAAPGRRTLSPGFQRGISYAMSNSIDGGYASPRSRATLERLSRMGVDAIAVMPFAFSPGLDRPEIVFVHRSARGETDEGTVRAVSDARALGMTVLAKPQIWLRGGAFVGDLAMRSAPDWNAWFDAYRRFTVHHAIVAEAAGAGLFCIGTELTATQSQDRQWRRTIAAVRLATGAPLLYAANWVSGAEAVPWWDALDVIGVDFYDPLSGNPEATDGDLAAGARRAAEPLGRLSRRYGRPVVFTEAGFPAVRAAWVAPHDEDSGRPRSAEDAARAIGAVFAALTPAPWWRGVYWWKAFSDGRDAGPAESGFNLLGTPSERAIAAGFQRLSGAAR